MFKFRKKEPGAAAGAAKKKKKTRTLIIIVAAVVVLGGGALTAAIISKMNSSDSTTTLTKRTAESTTLTTTVSGSGSVSNANQYSLTAAAAGTVKTLNVAAGDTVKKGEILAVIKSSDTTDTLLEKQSALDDAKSNLASAKDEINNLYIKTPVAGRVKSLIISSGDDISTAKLQSSNLCVISTAGTMYTNVSSTVSLTDGQKVYVYSKKTGKKIATGTVSVGSTSTNASTYTNTSTSTGTNYGTGTNTGTTSSSSTSRTASTKAASSAASSTAQQNTGSTSYTVTISTDTPDVGTSVTVKTTSGTTVGSGTLALTSYVALTTQNSGTMSKVYVTENQKVSKNTKIFKLSAASVEQSIKQAQEAVDNAQKAVDNAQSDVEALTIKSPIAGTVATLSVKKSSSVMNGSSICVIIDPNKMQTVISVSEDDISSVKVGQTANTTLSALKQTFSGKVTAIDDIGSSTNGSATYDVTVSIDNPTNVKVGMTTNTNVVTSSTSGIITVPAQAVLNISGTTGYILSAKMLPSSATTATLKNADLSALIKKYGKKVTIGTSSANEYQITSGLSAGDTYVVAVTITKSLVAGLANSTGSVTSTAGYSRFRNFNRSDNYSGNFGTGNTGGGNFGGGQ